MKPSYEELEEQLNRSRRLCDAALANERVWETTMMQACGEDGPKSVADKFAELEARCAALAAENAGLKKIVCFVTDLDNEPQYHDEGMGCGLEDRGITDRYEAMRHGWDEAMDRIYSEVIPDAIPETQATDAFLAEARAQGVEMCSAEIQKQTWDEREGDGMVAAIDAMEIYALQLRKGVQS